MVIIIMVVLNIRPSVDGLYVGMARVKSHVIRVQNGFKLSQNG